MPFVFKRLALVLSIAAVWAADKETPFKAQPAGNYAAHQTNEKITIGADVFTGTGKCRPLSASWTPMNMACCRCWW